MLILDIPKQTRKKAHKSPARAFRTLNVNQDSHRPPTTATTFLWVHGPAKLQLMIGHITCYARSVFLPVRIVALGKEESYSFANEIHLGLGRNFDEPHPFAHAHFMVDLYHVIIHKIWVDHRSLGKVSFIN